MARPGRPRPTWLLALWAVLAVLCLAGLNRGLWTPDEPREAEISREMYLSPGALPTLDGRPFYEKPPLYYWTVAGLFALTGGPSVPAARAVSGLSALLTLLLTFFWARKAADEETARRAVFMLATSLLFLYASHWVLLDPLLMLWVTASGWACHERLEGGGWPYLAALYGALALAIWTKGLVGAAIFLAGLALYAALARADRPLRRLGVGWGAAALILATALVLVAFYLDGGRQAVYQLVWVNHVERFLHPVATGHAQPPYYYLEALPLALAPWFVPFLLVLHPDTWRRQDGRTRSRLLLACLAGGMFLLLSIPSTKRETYLLPALPPLFILMAMAEAGVTEDSLSGRRFHAVLYRVLNPLFFGFWGLLLPVAVLAYTSPWAGPVLAALAAAAAALAGWFWASRGRIARAAWAHRVSALVFCLGALLLAAPALDRTKDMAPFVRWMTAQMPPGERVSALGADETLCGIIPFVTGRTVVPLSAKQFERLALEGKAPAFLVQQGDPRLKAGSDPGGAGYELVRERRFGPNRYLRLWRAHGPVPRPSGGPEGPP